MMHSKEELPGILRAVLIAGSTCYSRGILFLRVPSFRFHVLPKVVVLKLSGAALVLVAIADLDRPYQGNDVVRPDGFTLALRTFQGNGD